MTNYYARCDMCKIIVGVRGIDAARLFLTAHHRHGGVWLVHESDVVRIVDVGAREEVGL